MRPEITQVPTSLLPIACVTLQETRDWPPVSEGPLQKWDRISKLLPSGKSVSVSVKRKPKSKDGSDDRHYLVGITIDPEGLSHGRIKIKQISLEAVSYVSKF
jgi:hypothetical protein